MRSIALMLWLAAAPMVFGLDDNQTSCGSEELFQGEGQNTGGTYKPPDVTSCSATASRGQSCRQCREQYWDNGQPTGYTVCAYVTQSASCSCEIKGTACTNKGTCDYSSR
jgi:hypothetical protein